MMLRVGGLTVRTDLFTHSAADELQPQDDAAWGVL